MIEHTSRYAYSEPLFHEDSEGNRVAYLPRRFVPRAKDLAILTGHRVQVGDRLDVIATRTLGDPAQSWQICDANSAFRPSALTKLVGRWLHVPVPQFPTPR